MLRRNFLTVIGAAMIAGTALSPAKAADMDIVDTAVSNGSFTTLVAAVQAAGLVDTLKGKGPFTVFAPTDDAFAALPEGTVETLLKPENKDQLVQILTYHVVPAKVMSSELAGKRAKVLTVEGERLSVNGMGNGVKVGSSKVVAADVGASNGVIHVIDKVLIPEG
ncbi:fasciclin domain-containing protein [Sedimentitalea sp.]|uniref:fasciclin domain-containing protein n=1 Tax=Sedimentitalea sp. TaxID=2048915 RepID=UPI003297041C